MRHSPSMITQVMAAFMSVVSVLTNGQQVESVKKQEVYCLAQNIYHEARGTTLDEQKYVADVTLTSASRFKRTVCGEVFHPYRYSWTLGKTPKTVNLRTVGDKKSWMNAVRISYLKISGELPIKMRATHFHDYSVNPIWSGKLRFIKKTPHFVWYSEIKH